MWLNCSRFTEVYCTRFINQKSTRFKKVQHIKTRVNPDHKPKCTERRKAGDASAEGRGGRLEVAFNFFFTRREIRFHQLAESQQTSTIKSATTASRRKRDRRAKMIKIPTSSQRGASFCIQNLSKKKGPSTLGMTTLPSLQPQKGQPQLFLTLKIIERSIKFMWKCQ